MSARGHVNMEKDSNVYDVDFTAEHFPFGVLGKEVKFDGVKASIKSGKSSAPFSVNAAVMGGSFGLHGTMDTAGKQVIYHGALRIDALSFREFAKVYAPGQESDGDITGHMEFTARPNDWKSLNASGALVLLNGNLYAVPVLGPLTPLLGALLPAPINDYNVAKEANCTFHIGDGFIVTDDFEALTSAFKLVSRGTVDFVKDNVTFTAQARAKGLPGLVLFPVSELLEYKADGTVGQPNWRSHYFSMGEGRKRDERKAPTAAELEAAAKAAQKGDPPTATPRERPRLITPNGMRK